MKLEKCPYCESVDGYYERWCQSYIDYFNFDGSHQEAGEFTSAWGGKNKYCQKCNKKLN